MDLNLSDTFSFCFLRQSLNAQPCLVWNSICTPGWPLHLSRAGIPGMGHHSWGPSSPDPSLGLLPPGKLRLRVPPLSHDCERLLRGYTQHEGMKVSAPINYANKVCPRNLDCGWHTARVS